MGKDNYYQLEGKILYKGSYPIFEIKKGKLKLKRNHQLFNEYINHCHVMIKLASQTTNNNNNYNSDTNNNYSDTNSNNSDTNSNYSDTNSNNKNKNKLDLEAAEETLYNDFGKLIPKNNIRDFQQHMKTLNRNQDFSFFGDRTFGIDHMFKTKNNNY